MWAGFGVAEAGVEAAAVEAVVVAAPRRDGVPGGVLLAWLTVAADGEYAVAAAVTSAVERLGVLYGRSLKRACLDWLRSGGLASTWEVRECLLQCPLTIKKSVSGLWSNRLSGPDFFYLSHRPLRPPLHCIYAILPSRQWLMPRDSATIDTTEDLDQHAEPTARRQPGRCRLQNRKTQPPQSPVTASRRKAGRTFETTLSRFSTGQKEEELT